MKNKQKSILVRSAFPASNKDVNKYLDEGWTVKQIAPLGNDSGSAIVIVEKEEENKSPLGFKIEPGVL